MTEPDSGRFECLPANRPISNVPTHSPSAGNREFNVVLWMPPEGKSAGDIVLVDSTNFTTLFGGTQSLESFWRNVAGMRVHSPAENVLESFG